MKLTLPLSTRLWILAVVATVSFVVGLRLDLV